MNSLEPDSVEAKTHGVCEVEPPFDIKDLWIFDDGKLRVMLRNGGLGVTVGELAHSLHGASEALVQQIQRNVAPSQRTEFDDELGRSISETQVEAARRCVLEKFFWELTYWKTPELYEELVEGELLHPGIFRQLEPDIRGKVVLDAGAGSGRAAFECARYGARKIYAVEPSPGLLRILVRKIAERPECCCVVPLRGRFDELPLADESVDTALSCSAFTSDPAQGGASGLAEFRRVVKPGGKIVIIWPRVQDRDWLNRHGFHYTAMPVHGEMHIRFRTWQSALRCARHFNAQNLEMIEYIEKEQKPEVPFSMLGLNPPCDYCWLRV